MDADVEMRHKLDTGYILFIFSDVAGRPPEIEHHTATNIVRAIDRAKERGQKIAVFVLGDCLLDWR